MEPYPCRHLVNAKDQYVGLAGSSILWVNTEKKHNLVRQDPFAVECYRMFYGPGGHYALFAGRDATRALALLSFDPNDLTSNIEGLTSDQLEVLQDWEYKFLEKYVKVGQVVSEKSTKNATLEENENHQQGYAEDVGKD